MSASLPSYMSPLHAGPSSSGRRRRPPARAAEVRRPAVVYRAALEVAFARISVIDRLRMQGFVPAGRS